MRNSSLSNLMWLWLILPEFSTRGDAPAAHQWGKGAAEGASGMGVLSRTRHPPHFHHRKRLPATAQRLSRCACGALLSRFSGVECPSRAFRSGHASHQSLRKRPLPDVLPRTCALVSRHARGQRTGLWRGCACAQGLFGTATPHHRGVGAWTGSNLSCGSSQHSLRNVEKWRSAHGAPTRCAPLCG